MIERIIDDARGRAYLSSLRGVGGEALFEWASKKNVTVCRVCEGWEKEVRPRVGPLFVWGDYRLLSEKSLAIVGTRIASPWGKTAALRFAARLSAAGIHVVSGLAVGIDAAAHRGAMVNDNGRPPRGKTIAVLGSGLERIYPREHRALAAQIVDRGGCVVSEHPPEVPPLPHHFPLRNRVVAGLAGGVLVIEAPERSGALITARWANDLGKDVYALAAPYDDAGFRGNHLLVQEGAKLVFNIDDLIDVNAPRQPSPTGSDFLEKIPRTRPVSLQELSEIYPGGFNELMREIESCVEAGRLCEISPQIYVNCE